MSAQFNRYSALPFLPNHSSSNQIYQNVYQFLPLRQLTRLALSKTQITLSRESVIYSINSQRFFLYMNKCYSEAGATDTSTLTFKSSSFFQIEMDGSLKVEGGGGSYEVARQLTNVLTSSMPPHSIYSLAYRSPCVFIYTAFPREIQLSPFVSFNIPFHLHLIHLHHPSIHPSTTISISSFHPEGHFFANTNQRHCALCSNSNHS